MRQLNKHLSINLNSILGEKAIEDSAHTFDNTNTSIVYGYLPTKIVKVVKPGQEGHRPTSG